MIEDINLINSEVINDIELEVVVINLLKQLNFDIEKIGTLIIKDLIIEFYHERETIDLNNVTYNLDNFFNIRYYISIYNYGVKFDEIPSKIKESLEDVSIKAEEFSITTFVVSIVEIINKKYNKLTEVEKRHYLKRKLANPDIYIDNIS